MSRKEDIPDWSAWYPWSRELANPPAAIDYEKQVPIPSYEPILITVVIPVGPGHEQFVIDAIDSVDSQTFRLWECIVVNDTGHSLPMLPNWITLIDTTGEIGVAAARNLGLKQAKASLFVPLDADDTLEPEALSKLYTTWGVYKGYVYSDWYERWDDQPTKIWECSDYDAGDLTKKGCLHAVTALYPLSAWKDIGGFDETLSAWEDWDFQLQLAKLGICGIRIPEPLFTYRKSTGVRREQNYEEFEKSKEGIVDRWGPYFTGEEVLMACGGCAKKSIAKKQSSSSVLSKSQVISGNGDDLVLMEYVGDKAGSLNYKGPTGQIYRFGSMSGENQKFVHPNDVDHFLAMRDFHVIQKEAPVGSTS